MVILMKKSRWISNLEMHNKGLANLVANLRACKLRNLGLWACKLKKSLYGLQHASWQWLSKLSTSIIGSRFLQADSDHSLFIKLANSYFITLNNLKYYLGLEVSSNTPFLELRISFNYMNKPSKDIYNLKWNVFIHKRI